MQALAQNRQTASGCFGILFLEDFEIPEPPPAPPAPPPPPVPDAEPAPPLLTEADMRQACAEAHAAGYAAGTEQARGECAAATRRAVQAIAAALGDASETAAREAERNADALAGLLLGTLRTLLPALCDRFGVQEAAAVTAALGRGLCRQPAARVRINPSARPDVERAVCERLRAVEPELCRRLTFVDAAELAAGDIRIEWETGVAAREAARIWDDVAAVLAPLGLVGVDRAAPAAAA